MQAARYGQDQGWSKALMAKHMHKAWREVVRSFILEAGHRLDGRAFDEVRAISCEMRLLPRSKGSALFTRGQTQALVSVTIGGKEDAQLVDSLEGAYRDPFLVHYNFPSFSVGQVGKVGSVGRREIGHGKLAWRALRSVLPANFPYTLRIVSEITSSCGSSSMATVCGASLALRDAGLAVTPVAGIAMGLIQQDHHMALLSDISGIEDAIGDMDFKVAGTHAGITALQMDLKGQPLGRDFLRQVLERARQGRVTILNEMLAQAEPFLKLEENPLAPALLTTEIPQDKVRDLIGPGGKTIKELCETLTVRVDIGDGGIVTVFASCQQSGQKAIARIQQLVQDPKVGEVYAGTVVKVMDFGAFVNFGFAQDGMVHISEIPEARIEDIHQVLAASDAIRVKVLGFDRGRAKLSMKQV
jgi:polyribonucleotide nucleotidyltransferase